MASATVYWCDKAMFSGFVSTGNTPSTSRINFSTDTLKITLHTGVFSASTRHSIQFFSDISASEMPGGGTTGYVNNTTDSTNSKNLASVTWAFAVSGTTGTFTLNAATVTWQSTFFTGSNSPTFAAIHDRTAGSSDTVRPVLALVDFGGAQTTNNGDFVISWSAGGITTLSFP